ncbi:MAG: hypothetical protein HKN76_18470 [Saprospiraceae bacterium]|nr:hypothetical protein [Saprospiraceae bacterium]
MHYKKLHVGDTVVEFHNNWLGEETVIVFGKIVSKKSSILGTNHYFEVQENGERAKYVLTTKVDANLQVKIDLLRNGDLIQTDVPIDFGTMPKTPANLEKEKGLVCLKQYDLQEALDHFKKSLDFDAKDPEIYFHMACAYSVLEMPLEGFRSLEKAVTNNLQDTEAILNHDMLAYVRMHPAFEDFSNSRFTKIDESQFLGEKD